ncbi:MAG: hypothetical protein OEY49_01060 [Candidatus Heimdallarchaeota archaeon]|nr:hypothetical protein [Candidatus Heimdallarchaeota archaeon]
MVLGKIRFSILKRYTFLDSDEVEIGSLEDIALDPDTLVPMYFVLGAGFFEELMEEMGKREDIDELVPINDLLKLDDEFVIIKSKLSDLERTSHGKYPFKTITLSELFKMPVLDSNGQCNAVFFDFQLDGDNIHAIFNYPGVDNKMRSEGYGQRFTIGFTIQSIKVTDYQIILPTSLDDIASKIKNNIEPKMRGKSFLAWN